MPNIELYIHIITQQCHDIVTHPQLAVICTQKTQQYTTNAKLRHAEKPDHITTAAALSIRECKGMLDAL